MLCEQGAGPEVTGLSLYDNKFKLINTAGLMSALWRIILWYTIVCIKWRDVFAYLPGTGTADADVAKVTAMA